MTINNPHKESLQELLPKVQSRFPEAIIKKVFLSPEAIFIPYGNYKFVVRNRKDVLRVDHTLPLLYTFVAVFVSMLLVSFVLSLIYGQFVFGFGGALWIVLAIFLVKYIFQQIKKKEFEAFKTNFTDAISGFDFERRQPSI